MKAGEYPPGVLVNLKRLTTIMCKSFLFLATIWQRIRNNPRNINNIYACIC